MIINAKELRNKENLLNIPNSLPGYYKWWAEKTELDTILLALNAEYSELSSFIEQKDGLIAYMLELQQRSLFAKD